MRRRKGPMTPEMEAAYERAETLFTRARIIERGVAAFLNTSEYNNSNEMREASRMFAESIGFRKDGETIRDEMRRAEQEANPKGSKVTVHPKRSRSVSNPRKPIRKFPAGSKEN